MINVLCCTRLGLGSVTVIVCQFLVSLLGETLNRGPWRFSRGDSMNFPFGLIQCNFQIFQGTVHETENKIKGHLQILEMNMILFFKDTRLL